MSNGTYLSSSFTFLNLGCHMVFVLKNRLKAQDIPEEKGLKIVNDLVSAIFKEHFVKTLLVAQEPINLGILKDIFRKLAHSSIMKLDSASMEKLLYLIIMTLKKEVFLTSSPLELYSLTLGNLRMLQLHTKGTPAEALLTTTAQRFSSAAGCYSFVQYAQIREFLLTQLESYQTKVINFHESGQQNDQGKLSYARRNRHNKTPLGATRNHPPIHTSQRTELYLSLKEWRQWKTSLVLDHPSEYERQSLHRQSRSQVSAGGKDKSLNELFGLGKQKEDQFEVRLDLFDYEGSGCGYEEKRAVPTKSSVDTPGLPQKPQNTSSKAIKGKIEEQFAALTLDKEEEADLLDLMDN